MTAVPIWPGVTEYLYQAASSALVLRSGTWRVPFGLSPRWSSADCTPMAGMAIDTGGGRWRVPLREHRDADGGRAEDEQRRSGQAGQPAPGPPPRRRRGGELA